MLEKFIELLKQELDEEYEEQEKMLKAQIEDLDIFSSTFLYTDLIERRTKLNELFYVREYLIKNAYTKLKLEENNNESKTN